MITRVLTHPIGALTEPIYTLLGSNPHGLAVFLENLGDNPIQYSWRSSVENEDLSFADLVSDTDAYGSLTGTLSVGEVSAALIITSNPYVRLETSSAGGSLLKSSIHQYAKSKTGILSILTA